MTFGEILYRAALMLAGLVLVFAIGNVIYQMSIVEPKIPLAPFVIALAIWLVGLFCRKVSAA
jgi:uncharacterized membrane protein YcaP (DUF421 family)